MLIQHINGQMVIARQTDHMAQVARIAESWGNERFPQPEHREETVRAAALHDNGWRLWEARPTLVPETGRPCNLGEIEDDVHTAFYAAGVDTAAAVDPYTGLLVSLHATVLRVGVQAWDFERLIPSPPAGHSATIQSFVARQSALQDRLRGVLCADPRFAHSVDPGRLWPAYLRLRAWDQLSLYFVFRGMGQQILDLVPTLDGMASIGLRQIGPHEATAAPWPFDTDEVTFPVVVTTVVDRRYANADAFLSAWLAAEPYIVNYTMHRT